MERKFYTDDFEQLLKERSDEFRMYPSKRVWHSIYNDLHPGRKWPSVAVSLILIIALFIVGYWNNNNAADTNTIAANNNSQKNIAALQSGATNANPFQQDLYTAGKIPAEQHNNTTTQQPSFAFTSMFPHLATAPANGRDKNAADQVNEKNATPVKSVFDNIAAIISTGINNPVTFAVPETLPFKNEEVITANVDPSAKTNADKTTRANTTVTAKTEAANTVNAVNKENGYTVITQPVKANAEGELAATNTDAEAIANAKQNTTSTAVTTAGENEKAAVDNNKEKETKPADALGKRTMSAEDRSWMEDYAFHNKSKRKKWQDRTSIEFYITPGVTFSQLSNDPKYNMPASNTSFAGAAGAETVDHKPGLSMEAGVMLNYSLAKRIRVKAGVQANYTSYGIIADQLNHPVLTTLMLIDPNSGYPYMHAAPSTLANAKGAQETKVLNKTYQVSIPVGFALKLSGNHKLEWYAGATVQPTFVFGGKAYVISADRRNYVEDASLIRKWNINAGFETYINYKFDGFTFQVGPQLRYQALSTYYKKYTVNENLSNVGLKFGILKNF